MSEKIMIRLSEVTKDASIDQLKYWCKLLEIKPKIISRAAHVSNNQAKTLRKMLDKIQAGKKPNEAARMVSKSAVLAKDSPTNLDLLEKLDSLEKTVTLLVDQNQKLAATVETQNNQIAKLTRRLISPKLSIFQKFWYELTNPIKLRAI